jgi:hypothetical protein
MRELPLLDNLRDVPCAVDWQTMAGGERIRHCTRCRQNVYNLADMTREEAEALILGRTGRLRMRYFRRADGTVVLHECFR